MNRTYHDVSLAMAEGVDSTVMSTSELEEFARHVRGPLSKVARVRLLQQKGVLCIAPILAVGLTTWITAITSGAEVAIGTFTFGSFITFMIWMYGIETLDKSAHRRHVAAFLDRTDYASKLEAKRQMRTQTESGGREGDGKIQYPITGEYNPSRYYSFTDTERKMMKAHGMDADHWEANRPD